jgi:hypothetical protein
MVILIQNCNATIIVSFAGVVSLNHPLSAFALCKNSVHLGALTELQDKQSDNAKTII